MFAALTAAFYDAGVYDRFGWTLQVVQDPSPDPVFWGHQIFVADRPELQGYVGVQTNGAYTVGNRVAIFSMWGALSSMPGTTKWGSAVAASFPPVSEGGEGIGGQRCMIAFPWRAGKRYELDVSVSGTGVRARVDGHVIGTIALPVAANLVSYTQSFTERYGGPPCAEHHLAVARFENLVGTRDGHKVRPWTRSNFGFDPACPGVVVDLRRGYEHRSP